MGLPNINIEFQTQAIVSIGRMSHGTVAVILKDDGASLAGGYVILDESQIPTALGESNKEYIKNAFLGYVNRPKEVIAYVLPTTESDLSAALAYFALQQIDYLAAPPDCDATEAAEVAAWIKARRAEDAIPKAVLPSLAADSEGIINFTTSGIKVGASTNTAAQYCSRIAGLLAGTPLNIASTYAPLPEVNDVTRLSKTVIDAAIDAGQFIIFHDGSKVKAGRGVNSLITTTQGKGPEFKKIKIVEATDTIKSDIRMVAQDSYFGKYPNSYDNKCLLIIAIQGYFATLENEGVLSAGKSVVAINFEAQRTYLMSKGVDVSKLTDQQIKEADTGDKVFFKATIKILDDIEDIDLIIGI